MTAPVSAAPHLANKRNSTTQNKAGCLFQDIPLCFFMLTDWTLVNLNKIVSRSVHHKKPFLPIYLLDTGRNQIL